MTPYWKTRLTATAAALLIAGGLVVARPQVAPTDQTAALTQPMPRDPAISIGHLPNGLTYYVRANAKPEKRAELRLVVKAGSVLEDDTQQGLAHFIEHMAFNGTQHFPKNDIVSFIESLGMRFGADLNAYTSFDETVYMLQVPTDKPEVLDRAMLILEDWAHAVTFDPTEVDRERGVVVEEWRLGRGAAARVRDKEFPILLKGSRYADRLPIGKMDVVEHAGAAQLKKFYSDWYRPDLMAVVAVGDFDAPAVTGLIKSHFSTLTEPASPKPRPTYDLPDHAGTVYAVETDKELTNTTVELDNLLPARPETTIGAYRQEIVNNLFSGMLSARLSELTQKPDAPFVAAFAGRGLFFVRTKDDASLSALVKEGGVDRGLSALVEEATRVRRFGFTQTELDRQKQDMLRAYQRIAAETGSRVSASRADEYIRNFLEQESLPSADDEYVLHQRFLPQIALAEVNAQAAAWFPDNNRLVVVTAPDKAGVVVPDGTKLAADIAAAGTKALTPYVDTAGTRALVETPPTPGTITSTNTKADIGITEWELSNGVKVVLKPTTYKQDEILFRATSAGGTSLASDADFIPASTAVQAVSVGGLGSFNAIDLRKTLTGKVASASAFIGEDDQGVAGSASPKDLETLFQLIYLRFTAPRADPTAFGALQAQARAVMANQTASPNYAFVDALTSAMYGGDVRHRLPTAASVDQWNLDKSLAFYKSRFADASGFTFVFVGSFDPAALRPLVERYLGGLPSAHHPDTWKDVGADIARGVITKSVAKGIEPKSQVAIVFSGPFQYDQTQRIAIRAMAQVLQSRLLDTIREELGGTYSIGASASYEKIPRPEYTVSIQFGCDPQRTDALIQRVMQEIQRLKTDGPTPQQTTDVREALLREFETNSQTNTYLLSQIVFKYEYGEPVEGIWQVPDYYRKIDAAGIQQAARTYLNPANMITVTLVPEKN